MKQILLYGLSTSKLFQHFIWLLNNCIDIIWLTWANILANTHPFQKCYIFFSINFVLICLCSIIGRVNAIPFKRMTTLWIIVIGTASALRLGWRLRIKLTYSLRKIDTSWHSNVCHIYCWIYCLLSTST